MRDRSQVEEAVARTAGRVRPTRHLRRERGHGIYHPFLETPVEHIEEMVELNLLGTIWTIRACLPHLFDQGEGDVVTLASEAGRRASLVVRSTARRSSGRSG